MEQKILKEIEKTIKSSHLIIDYLTDYLKDDINRIIDDYELDVDHMNNDELPHITGYHYGFSDLMRYNNKIRVIINFFDECSESGIGIEEIDVDLTNFINWIDENY